MLAVLVLVGCVALIGGTLVFIAVVLGLAAAHRLRRWRKGAYTARIARAKGITFTP